MDNDLKLGFDAIAAKRVQHTLRWRYYDGAHPLAFVNPRIKEVIKEGVVFKKNWCDVVVRATRDRLKIEDWLPEEQAKNAADIWKKTLSREAHDIHTGALVTGESYLIVWPGDDGKLRAYAHDPRTVHTIYREDDPQTPRCAVKIWREGKRHFLNLYYPDRIEHYVANTEDPSSASAFLPAEVPVEPNIYGVIPVFHFRLEKRRCVGELTPGVLSLQDALNKLLNDMMVASEFSSFTQRWAIGNFDEGPFPIGPGTVLKIPATMQGEQPAATGAYPTTPPGNYLDPLGAITNDIAALSATPRHYFEGQGANISGEALQTMESPLVAKVEQYQSVLGATWQDAMAFALQASGVGVDPDAVEAVWAPAHTQQPQSKASTRLTNMQAGIPIINQLRDEGWSDDDLAQLITDAKAMTAAAQPPQTLGSPAQQAQRTGEAVDRAVPSMRDGGLAALESVNSKLLDRLVQSSIGRAAS